MGDGYVGLNINPRRAGRTARQAVPGLDLESLIRSGKARPLALKEAFQGTGWGVSVLESGFVLAAGGNNKGRVWFWKTDDGVNVHTFNVAANVRDLAVHPDGTAFATAGANGTATLFTMA